MTFWDGQRWLPEAGRRSATPGRTRRRDWAATAVMLLVVVAAAIPASAVFAGSRLSVSPSSATAGSTVTVTGAGFRNNATIQLTWNRSSAGMPAAFVVKGYAFSKSVTVPAVAAGKYTIAAEQLSSGTGRKGAKGSSFVVASVSVTVVPVAGPTPTPTPRPTPTPTPRPLPTATPRPTGTPVPTATPAPPTIPKLFFGVGTQVEGAGKDQIVQEAPVEILSSWYNSPNDLGWMTDSWHKTIYKNAYAAGHAIHLITWTNDTEITQSTSFGSACGRGYPLSTRFADDMRQLAQAFAGTAGGPPLYVTMFTEFQTYACSENAWAPNAATTNYYKALKARYEQAISIFHQYAPNSKVSIGWGGWQTRFDQPAIGGGASMIPYFADVMHDSDFISFQAMAGDSNVSDIRNMTRVLGAYGPVMLAHHMPDGDRNDPATVDATFSADLHTLLTDSNLASLKADGLFAWSFMHDGPLTRSTTLYSFVKTAISRYGAS